MRWLNKTAPCDRRRVSLWAINGTIIALARTFNLAQLVSFWRPEWAITASSMLTMAL